MTYRYAECMAQVVTRLSDELVASVDALVADGTVASRSEAVRLGLERLVDLHRRQAIGQQIADSYRSIPQTTDDIAWADASTVAMIADEAW